MKRMAALLAVMGALSAVVPATAPAATKDKDKKECLIGTVLVLRFC